MENLILAHRVRMAVRLILITSAAVCIGLVLEWWMTPLLFGLDYLAFRWHAYEHRRMQALLSGAFEEFASSVFAHRAANEGRRTTYVETEGGDHD